MDSSTWNHLIVCKEMSSHLFKNVIYKYLIITWNFQTLPLSFIITSFQSIYSSAFLPNFHIEFEVLRQSRTIFFIWKTGTDCSMSVNYDRVHLSNNRYSLLDLTMVGIKPATTWKFLSEASSKQPLYPPYHDSFPSNSEFWGLMNLKFSSHFLISHEFTTDQRGPASFLTFFLQSKP